MFVYCAATVSVAQEYAFRSFTAYDGLVSNYITAIKQDSKGYLWIGTDEGFSIFDGKIFVNVHAPYDSMWGHINKFEESKADRDVMWIGTNGGGLLKYSKGNYQNISIDTVPEANHINDLYEGSDGTLWCATDNGLYKISEQQFDQSELHAKLYKATSQIFPIDDEHLWISHPNGIIVFSIQTGETKEILSAKMVGGSKQIVSFLTSEMKAVITSNTVYMYAEGKFKKTFSIPVGILYGGTIDSSNNLWISGTQCAYQLKNIQGSVQLIRTFGVYNGLPVNDVSVITADRENNLWFGTMGKGIVRLQDGDNFRFRFDGLSTRGTSDVRGRMWVPSVKGLYSLDLQSDNTWATTFHRFQSNDNPVALQVRSADTLWCTTANQELSAYRIRKHGKGKTGIERIITMGVRNGFPLIYQNVLFKDSRGFLWCAKDKQGVVIVSLNGKPKVKKIYDGFRNLAPMTISAFTETSNGNVFAGGNGTNAILEFEFIDGTYRLHKIHRFHLLISPYGIRSLAGTPDGSLWIGTRYDGIIRRLPNGDTRHFTTNDGLHSMQIHSLHSSGKSLWIGTQSGVEYIPDIDVPRFFVSEELTKSPVYTIGSFDQRTIWAMSRYEVTMTDTKIIETSVPKSVPPIYLTRFDVNGILQSQTTDLEILGSDLISCSFSYACVTLKGNTVVRYQYQLEGLHDQWQNPMQERSVTFANLGYGRYTFRVRAVLNNGEQMTDTVSQSFIIVPPLWNRWWFIPMLLVILFSFISAIYVLGIRQQIALEKIRVSIAADLHDDIGSALARIANLADILVMHLSSKTVRRSKKHFDNEEIVPITNPTKIASLSRELLDKMSDVVWSVNPSNDDLKKLLERVQTYVTEVAESHALQLQYVTHGRSGTRRIDPQTSRATLLIIKEALSNILTHSKATTVHIIVEISERFLTIQINDNGIGFIEKELPRINGIYNMRNRAELCGGSMTILSELHIGSELRVYLPI